MHDKLKEIYKAKLDEIGSITLDDKPERAVKPISFKALVEKNKDLSLIAEIKKASPSKGIIRQNFNIDEIIAAYKRFNPQAISVLTDSEFFQGSADYLRQVKQSCNIPVLRKDFIIDEKQVYESYGMGADMILLIVAMLDDKKLYVLHEKAKTLGMEVLVETHSADEINRAVAAGAEIIGINNRDLNTFKVDINNALRLVKRIPDGIIRIAESGIHTAEDIRKIRKSGFNAVLIGEAFMLSPDIVDVYGKLFSR